MKLAAFANDEEITVLLVEDSAIEAASIMQKLLQGKMYYSFNIVRKNSLQASLAHLRNHSVDAILLDLGLPDAKELKAVVEISNHFPDVPIVILSGYSNFEMINHALQSGAQEFLIKGECSPAAIRQSIYQAIVRKRMALSHKR